MFDGAPLQAPKRAALPARLRRGVRGRIGRGALVSLLLHAAMLLGFVSWGGRERPPEPLPPPAFDVEFMRAGSETGPRAPELSDTPSLDPPAPPVEPSPPGPPVVAEAPPPAPRPEPAPPAPPPLAEAPPLPMPAPEPPRPDPLPAPPPRLAEAPPMTEAPPREATRPTQLPPAPEPPRPAEVL
ncbi:MAG TPA: hypothetical protein VD970_19875, partial [Acetobacteraceae bacterium]|nr:hypothetical protein [Acetobacteraceae bacterium]